MCVCVCVCVYVWGWMDRRMPLSLSLSLFICGLSVKRSDIHVHACVVCLLPSYFSDRSTAFFGGGGGETSFADRANRQLQLGLGLHGWKVAFLGYLVCAAFLPSLFTATQLAYTFLMPYIPTKHFRKSFWVLLTFSWLFVFMQYVYNIEFGFPEVCDTRGNVLNVFLSCGAVWYSTHTRRKQPSICEEERRCCSCSAASCKKEKELSPPVLTRPHLCSPFFSPSLP
jgi:hypothetical protein